MNCQFCGESLSALVVGLGSLVSFMVVPMIQILFASLQLVFDKIISLRKNL